MCGALDGVALTVRPVVGGIDAPSIASAVVVLVTDAVHHGIAQLHVLVLHVDLGAQYVCAVGELACTHAAEQRQVLVDRAVAERTLDTRLAIAATLRRDRLRILVVDVGEALLDEVLSPLVDLLEVVAGVPCVAIGLEAEPAHVLDDGIDVFGVFGDRVGVVEPQRAHTTELLGDTPVDADRLGMPDVQVAVRFRWEAGLDALEATLGEVGAREVAYEVRCGWCAARSGGVGGVGHRGTS